MEFITTGNRIAVENFEIGYFYTITMLSGNHFQACCTGIGSDFVMFSRDEPDLLFSLTMQSAADVSSIELYGGGSGTNDYNDLINKPQINSITLIGNKSISDLGIQETISDLDTIRSGAAAGATAVQPADLATALATKQDTLSSAQLAAVNSGIDSTKVAQIETNKNNISLCKAFTDNATIDSDRQLYITATEPTGDIPIGSTWINGKTIKTYAIGPNLCDGIMEQGSISSDEGSLIETNSRIRTVHYMTLASGTYTVNFAPQKRVLFFKYATDGTFISRIDTAWNNTPYTFTLNNTYKIKFIVGSENSAPIIPTDISDIMLNTGTSAESYIPYGGTWS